MKKFYKRIIAGAVALMSCLTLVACNKDIWDFHYTFDAAIINLNGKYITVDIDQWTDYEGEQIQLKLQDGSLILVSSFNTILVCTNGKGKSEIFDYIKTEDISEAQANKAEE